MSDFTRQMLKVVVAKICQTIGWHGINSTPLEIMVDLLRRYFVELTRLTHAYATQFGHVHPNLDELGLAFRDMHINIADLEEYVQYVESSPAIEVPFYPVPKESHLNFLKPGSSEVVTRPVHVHEHLPPMLPESEEREKLSLVNEDEPSTSAGIDYGSAIFRRPTDVSSECPAKRPRLLIEEEGRPTREISSVMMTTSGFLSPAREGKLPEARTPVSTLDQIMPVPSTSTAGPSVTTRNERKFVRAAREKKADKRRDRTSKELFKPDEIVATKKVTTKKAKLLQEQAIKNEQELPLDLAQKPVSVPTKNSPKTGGNKSRAGKAKLEKHSTSIPSTSTASDKTIPSTDVKLVEGKLSAEPDRLKLNIFKKISKVKDDKVDKIEKIKKEEIPVDTQSRESSPDLIIDESDSKWEPKPTFADIKTEQPPIKISTPEISGKLYDVIKNSPQSEKDFLYDDYMSPPGTPLTPKTPEMPQHSPPMKTEKRKRKDKSKVKKGQSLKTATREKIETVDVELERPKTPDSINLKSEQALPNPSPVFPFLPNLGGPGLIPPLMPPLFSRLPSSPFKYDFGQLPQMSPFPSFPIMPLKPQDLEIKPEEIKVEPPADPPELPEVPVKEKHKKDKKDKIKKKSKKDKIKNKSEKRKIKEEKKEKDKIKKIKKEKKKEKEREPEGSVPKLTLKISSPRPPTPDTQLPRKITIIKPVKPTFKKESVQPSTSSECTETKPPPELARISALVHRPPKLKSKETKDETVSPTCPTPKAVGGATRGRPSNVSKAAAAAAAAAQVQDDKPTAGKPPKPPGPSTVPGPSSQEPEENKVWICPACGRQDDGSPMIGCDDCDAWYHWVCVGIQVPPDDNEDWYCRICIVKKQEMLQVDKKKKRKKKEKKHLE